MKLFRLSGRKVCERVKTKGFLWKGKHMQIRWLRGQPRSAGQEASVGLYVGLLTSAKLHKSAVKRNRMRRRCREAMRVTLKAISDKRPVRTDIRPGGLAMSSDKLTAYRLPARTFPFGTGGPLTACQLLLLPRSSSLSADFRELIADIDRFLSSL